MSKKTARQRSDEPEEDLFDEALEVVHAASIESVKLRGRPLRVVETEVEGDVIAMLFQGVSVYTIHDRLKRERGVDVSISALYRVKRSLKGVLDDPALQDTIAVIGSRLDVLDELQKLLARSEKRLDAMAGLEKVIVTPAGNQAIEQHRKVIEVYAECLVGRLSGNRPSVEQMMRAVRRTASDGSVEEGIEFVRNINDPELLERLFRAVGIELPVIDLDAAGIASSADGDA